MSSDLVKGLNKEDSGLHMYEILWEIYGEPILFEDPSRYDCSPSRKSHRHWICRPRFSGCQPALFVPTPIVQGIRYAKLHLYVSPCIVP